jgi:hypothetical protein
LAGRKPTRGKLFVFQYPSLSDHYRLYYQHRPERLATCSSTIHALLHIADSIEAAGPVWASWAFPMERFCGGLRPAVKSRRFPYSSIDRYLVSSARLTQCQNIYNLVHELSLRSPERDELGGRSLSEKCTLILYGHDAQAATFLL